MTALSLITVETIASTEELAGARAIAAARLQGITNPRVISVRRSTTSGTMHRWAAVVSQR